MVVPSWLLDAIRSRYRELSWGKYREFRSWIENLVKAGQFEQADAAAIFEDFPDPNPFTPSIATDDEGTEAKFRDPPDHGRLAQLKDHGWVTEEIAHTLRLSEEQLHSLINLDDPEVALDVQENALHILGRCNDPRSWGANRQGLVYGMVQSGKTASMTMLIQIARAMGYRLFIILAGDKSSLRDQTQGRINRAFGLTNGVNTSTRTHSPTYHEDFGYTGMGYSETFRYLDLVARGESWTTIIVIKKQKDHLDALTRQLRVLKERMAADTREIGAELPAMIMDDEADYASQNTDVYGFGNTIHRELVDLRRALPRNTYVGYTATPQACLGASLEDPIGYPKDFIWLLEPFMDRVDGTYKSRSYLGAWEVFRVYDRLLVHEMGQDEWPHHIKDPAGKHSGIYLPDRTPGLKASLVDDARLVEIETAFLAEIRNGSRPVPGTILRALLDFIIGCGVRWWRYWKQSGEPDLPTPKWVEDHYPYHAAMIHLSLNVDNQESIRDIVQREWQKAVELKQRFDPDRSPQGDLFREAMRHQRERTESVSNAQLPPWEHLSRLIDICIEIAGKPINSPSGIPFAPYPDSPFVYMLNSATEGMELLYDESKDFEIRTKKAAIIVGGQILSRGLTVEGLSVSVFGRTAEMPMGDATLQMGRWFGHRMDYIDLFSVYLQRQVRDLMRDLAEADYDLRLQVKDSIYYGYPPDRILIELRNSPFFRATSPSKSAFLEKDGGGMAFSGRTALLNQPKFELATILQNLAALDGFAAGRIGESAHSRATLYRNVALDSVIQLFDSLSCDENASQVSFQKFAGFLRDWRDGTGLPKPPPINVAIMDNPAMRRKRLLGVTMPTTPGEARANVQDKFDSIIGGTAHDDYKGDAFLDKDPSWHLTAVRPAKQRQVGDPILIVFYRLQPNYVCKQVWDPSLPNSSGRLGDWKDVAEVRLVNGDPTWVDTGGRPEEACSIVVYAAWSPLGGPMYDVLVNRLIDTTRLFMRGRETVSEEEDDSDPTAR